MVLTIVQSAFLHEVLVSEFQFRVKNPEAGVKIQPHIALWTFKSYPLLFFFQNIWPYICFLFEASDHYFALWASCWSTLPPPVKVWIRSAQGWDCVLSVHYLSLSHPFHCHFQVSCFSRKAFSKYLALRIQLLGTLFTKQCTPTGV